MQLRSHAAQKYTRVQIIHTCMYNLHPVCKSAHVNGALVPLQPCTDSSLSTVFSRRLWGLHDGPCPKLRRGDKVCPLIVSRDSYNPYTLARVQELRRA